MGEKYPEKLALETPLRKLGAQAFVIMSQLMNRKSHQISGGRFPPTDPPTSNRVKISIFEGQHDFGQLLHEFELR